MELIRKIKHFFGFGEPVTIGVIFREEKNLPDYANQSKWRNDNADIKGVSVRIYDNFPDSMSIKLNGCLVVKFDPLVFNTDVFGEKELQSLYGIMCARWEELDRLQAEHELKEKRERKEYENKRVVYSVKKLGL